MVVAAAAAVTGNKTHRHFRDPGNTFPSPSEFDCYMFFERKFQCFDDQVVRFKGSIRRLYFSYFQILLLHVFEGKFKCFDDWVVKFKGCIRAFLFSVFSSLIG